MQNAEPNEYDCIISRGGTAEFIRRVTDLPVVEIPISVYDVLRVIKLAENYSNLYAIVGFPGVTGPAHTLCSLLRYNLDILTVHNTKEVYDTLTRLQQGGYRMVVSDMVTHTIARRLGMDAFLITSGIESLQEALHQAVDLSAGFRRLRQESAFLRCALRSENFCIVVLDAQGGVCYFNPSEPNAELLSLFRSKCGDLSPTSPLSFYYNHKDSLCHVTAQHFAIGGHTYSVFCWTPSTVALRSSKTGLRFLSKSECEHLFLSSFYSISGALGELEHRLEAISSTHQPVMIIGETGTGKEQIARFLYMHGPWSNRPFVVVDCTLVNDKSWEFLLNHYDSPLVSSGGTVYFQHLESLSEEWYHELVTVILETGTARRQRLIFSCNCADQTALPTVGHDMISKLGCMTLRLPSLRSRKDEIPSLASLYLGSLNQELGKQLSGFEPRAIEQLQMFDWPHNYTQFKQVLTELATLTTTPYINSTLVAEILDKERSLLKSSTGTSEKEIFEGLTLNQITQKAVHYALAVNNGNRTAAAQQLGIGRSTLWRYCKE